MNINGHGKIALHVISRIRSKKIQYSQSITYLNIYIQEQKKLYFLSVQDHSHNVCTDCGALSWIH